jgi:hypothetical protein
MKIKPGVYCCGHEYSFYLRIELQIRNYDMGLLAGLKFPTFKSTIIDYVKKCTSDSDVISLFENLDGYIEFKDEYQKAFEENNSK